MPTPDTPNGTPSPRPEARADDTSIGVAQFGIALGALGVVLTLMGLFPGVTGIEPGVGVGVVQMASILIGFALLVCGALLYVKDTFYRGRTVTLTQQAGVRLALTGLVLAGMAGLADFLGFGSHPRTEEGDVYFGLLQALGVIGGFSVAALGVLLYALMGAPPEVNPAPPEID